MIIFETLEKKYVYYFKCKFLLYKIFFFYYFLIYYIYSFLQIKINNFK